MIELISLSTLDTLAGLVFFCGNIPYVLAILKPANHPNRAWPMWSTWLIWAFADTIVLAMMWEADTFNWQILSATVGSWIIFFLAVTRGRGGISRLDMLVLMIALCSIFLWVTSDDKMLSVVMGNTALFVAGIPTIKSVWKDPHNENRAAWTLYFVSSVLMVWVAYQLPIAKTVELLAQPLTFLTMTTIVMCIFQFRR